MRSNPPLASQGGSSSIHHIRYSIHTPYTIHRTPQARNRTPPPASEGVRPVRDIPYIEPPSWSWGFGTAPGNKWGPENRTNYPPPSNLRNINDYPPSSSSKSARKIAPTTPPLEFTEHQRLPPPPRNRPGKSLNYLPARIYGTSSTTPPRNRTPLFKTLAYGPGPVLIPPELE